MKSATKPAKRSKRPKQGASGKKPRYGVCRVCRCTDARACDGGCFWIDSTHSLCSACVGRIWAELLAVCKAQHRAINILFARLAMLDKKFLPSKSGVPWEAICRANDVIAAAEGGGA